MIEERLLVPVLVGEAVLFVLFLALATGHALVVSSYERWARPRLRGARSALVRALDPTDASPADPDMLAALPARLQHRLLLEMAPSLRGDRRAGLRDLADAAGIVRRGERLVRSRSWARRLYGARLLTAAAAGGDAVRRLLDDPAPLVRAQAAEWMGTHGAAERIPELLDMLADPVAICRFSAQEALLRLGEASIEPLARFVERGGGAPVVAGLEVAVGLADPAFLPVALSLGRSPEAEVRALAARLVGALGGSEAVDAMLDLTEDPAPEVRAAAAEAVGLLGHWPAAPRIARLLRDPDWEVRRSAGLALEALGAPGELLLRRALSDPDPFAAGMARQLLDAGRAAEGSGA